MTLSFGPAFLLLLLSFLVTFKGAEWFVDSAAGIAEDFHLPKALIGATIVSLATTTPELLVSVLGAALGKTQMAAGNAVGSPIVNIGFIFATCTLFTFIPVSSRIVWNQGLMMLTTVVLLFLFGTSGVIDRVAAFYFLFLTGLYLWYSVKTGAAANQAWHRDNNETEIQRTDLKKEVGFFFLGAGLVAVGSRLLITSGSAIAHLFGVSESVIGLTLLAFGNSLPEFFTSVTALTKGHREISAGNIIGANILDITWVLGAASLVRPLPLDRQTVFFAIPLLFLLTLLFLLFGHAHRGFVRWEGGVLLLLFGSYCWVLFRGYAN